MASRARWERTRATPPPGTIPSSTAERVAERASSTRALRSLSSIFSSGADLDDGHAAGQLGHPLLELLAVVLGGGLFDLGLDLVDAGLDRIFGAVAFDDGGLVLGGCSTRRATAKVFDGGRVELRPVSSLMTVPPVRMAMSSSMALRRSPKPGALTARTFRVPRSLLTTRVARASPSTSSATITTFFCADLQAAFPARVRGRPRRRSSCR